MLIIAAGGVVIARWNWLFPDADRLLEEALTIRNTSPVDSQLLLDRAIEIREGDFPDANSRDVNCWHRNMPGMRCMRNSIPWN